MKFRILLCIVLFILIISPIQSMFATVEIHQGDVYISQRGLYPGWDILATEYYSDEELAQYRAGNNSVRVDRILQQRIDTERAQMHIYFYYFRSSDDRDDFQEYAFENWQRFGALYVIENTIMEIGTEYPIDRIRLLNYIGISYFDQIKMTFDEIPEGFDFMGERLLVSSAVDEISERLGHDILNIRIQQLGYAGNVSLTIIYYELTDDAQANSFQQTMENQNSSETIDYILSRNVVMEINTSPIVDINFEDLE